MPAEAMLASLGCGKPGGRFAVSDVVVRGEMRPTLLLTRITAGGRP